MTTTAIEAIWEQLAEVAKQNAIPSPTYKLTRIDEEHPFDVFAGIDSDSKVLLAVGTSARPPSIELNSTALDYFRQQRVDGSWLMVLRLQLKGLEAVFGRLCQDLADAARSVESETALLGLFWERLELWKRLFQHTNSGLLEKYQVKGLVAELLQLEELLHATPMSAIDVVSSWLGPTGADQDFFLPSGAIEVKAISPSAEEVSISSLGQLEAGVPITLRIYELRDAGSDVEGSINLVDLVARIEGKIALVSEALRIFRARVLEAGYIEHKYYEELGFLLVRVTSFAVGALFPKLVTSAVPDGVVRANYSISLAKIEQFKLDLPVENG